ncbi:hypothetical protein EVAR_20399_1 [Eumeta japonica]|uniref:Uncharacterized protein n=1 Tax=Eumeta variegata TaxID=151549 RepID=A0A4C1TXU4_EUMVA|nr:hypothetical protein EVAR_20399_1 [Eumeta japonica]
MARFKKGSSSTSLLDWNRKQDRGRDKEESDRRRPHSSNENRCRPRDLSFARATAGAGDEFIAFTRTP